MSLPGSGPALPRGIDGEQVCDAAAWAGAEPSAASLPPLKVRLTSVCLPRRSRDGRVERSELRLPTVRVAEGLRRSAEALRRGRPDQRRGPRHLELAHRALHRVELTALIGLRQRPGEQPPQSLTPVAHPRPRACGADFPRPPACSGSTSDVRGEQRPPASARGTPTASREALWARPVAGRARACWVGLGRSMAVRGPPRCAWAGGSGWRACRCGPWHRGAAMCENPCAVQYGMLHKNALIRATSADVWADMACLGALAGLSGTTAEVLSAWARHGGEYLSLAP